MLFEEAIGKISAVGIEPGLAVITELLRQLGDPQKKLAVIHVAGTNGKGSVCAMLERCLREAGIRTGLYTSPHMIRYNERFRVSGEEISDENMMELLTEVGGAADRTEAALGKRPTEFEILTGMAFLWFFRQEVQVLVLETGMGGRFDATNVFPEPLLTLITGISLDHEAYLGNKISGIAWEKAGIIKHGVPLVTACSETEAMAVIRDEFNAVQGGTSSARLIQVWDECRWEAKSLGLAGQTVDLTTPLQTYNGLTVRLPGQYQCANLGCVVSAWEILAGRQPGVALPAGLDPGWLTEEALRKGLASVKWPCRLEQVMEKPAVVLDGSHNPEGLRHLAAWLSEHRPLFDQILLVMGMVADKDRLSAAEHIDGLVSRVIITKPLSARAGQWQDLARGFRSLPEEKVTFIEDCHQAVKTAIGYAGDHDLVLCTGSFYLVGELRKNWEENEMF